jgi:hypothetical protein
MGIFLSFSHNYTVFVGKIPTNEERKDQKKFVSLQYLWAYYQRLAIDAIAELFDTSPFQVAISLSYFL